MNNFKKISASDAIEFSYDNGKCIGYITCSLGTEKFRIVKIYCHVNLVAKSLFDRNSFDFPFSNPSSTEPVVNFFTDLVEQKLIRDPSLLLKLKKDVEEAVRIEKEDFKKHRIFFDLDLRIGNTSMYYELPGQPPCRGEYEEDILVQKFQADMYYALKNMFYKPENAKFLRELFKEYENFFISWWINYATEESKEAVYSSKHSYDEDVNSDEVIYKK